MPTPTLRAGPVAITGANGQVGTALQERLQSLKNAVIPLHRGSDVAAGVRDAEVVVHLAGTLRPRRPDSYDDANVAPTQVLVDALQDAAVRRVVFLSFLTADVASPNPYLRAKGRAEALLWATGVPTVVLRTGHVVGPPDRPGPTASAMLARRGRVSVLGPGTQRIAPVLLDDVGEALTRAALDPSTPTGTFPLTGPVSSSVDDLVRQLNGAEVAIRHLPPWAARTVARVTPTLPVPLVDVMLADAVAPRGPDETARAFGITLHPLTDVWPTTGVSTPHTTPS